MRVTVAILHQHLLDCLACLLSCKYSSFYDIRWWLILNLYDARLAFFISSDRCVLLFFLWLVFSVKSRGIRLAWIIEFRRFVSRSLNCTKIEDNFLTWWLLLLWDLCASDPNIARWFLAKCCSWGSGRFVLFRWGWCTIILSVFPFCQGRPLRRFLLLWLRLFLLLLLLLLLFLRWFSSS